MKTDRWLLLAFYAVTALVARAELSVAFDGKVTVFAGAELAALPRTEIAADDPHDKKPHRYAGFAVRELLARAGAPLGEKLRGPALQLGVIVRAKDGYGVLFSLAEFDESFSNRTLLLADRVDGGPLPEKSAPLQLIAPGDKRAARWIRMVTSLEIVTVPSATPAAIPAKP